MTKGEYVRVAMMLKTGTKVTQYYSIFRYGRPIPHNRVKYQYRTIVEDTGVNLAPKFVRRKLGRKSLQMYFIWITSKTLLATTVDEARGNTGGFIVYRFVKSRASIMFGHPVYFLYWTGPSIEFSGPHEDF